jgi:hypothetical protein
MLKFRQNVAIVTTLEIAGAISITTGVGICNSEFLAVTNPGRSLCNGLCICLCGYET